MRSPIFKNGQKTEQEHHHPEEDIQMENKHMKKNAQHHLSKEHCKSVRFQDTSIGMINIHNTDYEVLIRYVSGGGNAKW